MTKKLEELFNLPTDSDTEDDLVEAMHTPTEQVSVELVTQESLDNLEKIDAALPAIRGLEAADHEMDEIAAMALSSYKDLLDLGMNVEARVASDILASASSFMGHAITAKNAKVNKKLKMLELQLKKAKLDQDERKMKGPEEGEHVGTGTVMDRNELLEQILKKNKEDSEKG